MSTSATAERCLNKMDSDHVTEKSSDIVSEESEICSVCKEQNKATVAEKLCVDCCDYYCEECVRIHTTVPAMRTHKLLNKGEDQYKQVGTLPTERCERHGLKVIDMFCEDHDEVGCNRCMTVDHRTCKKVVYIPEIATAQMQRVCEFQENMTQIQTRLQSLLEKYKVSKNQLIENKQQQLDEVTAVQHQIEQNIRTASNATKSDITEVYDDLTKNVENGIITLKEELNRLNLAKEYMKQLSSNPSQLFVAAKCQKNALQVAKTKYDVLDNNNHYRRIHVCYQPETPVRYFVHNAKLGTVKVAPLSFKKAGSVSIKKSEDTKKCDVYGMCITEDGSIVVSDRKNKNVKAVNQNTTDIISYYLSSAPWGLCHVKNISIAVCLPNMRCIHMLIVDAKNISKVGSVQVGFQCRCVSYHDNNLYVTDKEQVYRCDMEGKILNKFRVELDGQHVLKNINALTVNKFNGYIYVGDNTDIGTIILDVNGKVVNRIPQSHLEWPHGLCSGDAGNTFVSGYDSKKILRLSMNGENLGSIIEGLSGPQAICFDSKCGRLYVSNHKQNDLLVYEAE